jgi:hypothetical protein
MAWNYDVHENKADMHRLTDELIDYLCTKIRPVSIMIGNQQARDNMLQVQGQGLC